MSKSIDDANDSSKEAEKTKASKWEALADADTDTETTLDSEENVSEQAKDTKAERDEDDTPQNELGIELESRERLEEELNADELKIRELTDQVYRITADLQNVKRRAQEDVKRTRLYALEKFGTELLMVIDSMEHGLEASNHDQAGVEHLREGMELTHKMFLDVIARFDVKPIDPKGEAFDPHLHEAMSTEENEDVPDGTVLMVYQRGYMLNDRLLRPARVVVAKGGPKK